MSSARVCVLDGGMGHELKMRGISCGVEEIDRSFKAGALANENSPDIVRDVHMEYIRAGADVITTNTFVLTPYHMESIGRTDKLLGLLQAACERANEAVALVGRAGVRVAASLPPLQDCYRPEQVGGFEDMVPVYKKIADTVAPFVDILLCETMSTGDEAAAAVVGASGSGRLVWLSWTLEDSTLGRLRSGETIQAAVQTLDSRLLQAAVVKEWAPSAVLLNCCAPQAVTAALSPLKAALHTCKALAPGVSIGGYANGFRSTTSEWLNGEGNNTSNGAARMANLTECIHSVTVKQEYNADGY
eukprot:CAMPEP_0198199792 /NCGR_PEP_ID=MMETSP1445-20131203/2953_1 /TAXON_ID=36898 /ORGANISM="Pyramimonas sp., Strain CCMP2087" /LENGTH=301 /DNA_ID=CAMNT_0043869687 /DNA_START=135 /DNA_END=1037 /DNA_ORIENTATION=+